ncbi:hypothetical protein EYV94_03900 [Puteibacter caeruleilacunae]|nr:hypothetical protein EYV94_03900 [Puteibacter caeruleilacunae]
MYRREFLEKGAKGIIGAFAFPTILSFTGKHSSNEIIDKIELYRYDVNIPRYFSFGTWLNRQHVYMKISSGEHYGWSEITGGINKPGLDLKEWSSFLQQYRGKTIKQILTQLQGCHVKKSPLSWGKQEFIEIALLDLMGRIENKPALEILNLKGRKPVPGLYCILDKDMENVKKNAEQSVKQNLSAFMKIKMYGDLDLDKKVLKTVREVIGDDTFVLSDVNEGYKEWKDVDELASILKELHSCGLNAVEDPAKMSREEWIELQKKVGKLDLIPDVPMRPSWEALKKDLSGMGRIYNIHPACMGSISIAAKLGLKVKSMGAKLMVGDASTTGPSCTAWQQIAIGTGAAWVEAIEKFDDSDGYLKCIKDKATYRDENGLFAYRPKSGFGLELDEERLRTVCSQYLIIGI